MYSSLDIFRVLNSIPLSVEGSNLECIEWNPPESEIQWMGEVEFNKCKEDYLLAKSKVLFENVSLQWDSCDCGGGYPCSHGSYVYEIQVTNKEEVLVIDREDDDLVAEYNNINVRLPELYMTCYDFYRLCEILGFELEFSESLKQLLCTKTESDAV